MIVIGYQGIGKTTSANKRSGVIDLESSLFYNGDERIEDWYKYYCKIAVDLSKQNNMVFVSSHKIVRDELKKYIDETKIYICYPALELKDEWINNLEKRYNSTKLDKDYRAYINAKNNYTENIIELMKEKEFIHIPLREINPGKLVAKIIHNHFK